MDHFRGGSFTQRFSSSLFGTGYGIYARQIVERRFLGTVERWKSVLWKRKEWSFNWQYVYYIYTPPLWQYALGPRYHIALVRRLHGYTATVPNISCCCLVSVGYERSEPCCVHDGFKISFPAFWPLEIYRGRLLPRWFQRFSIFTSSFWEKDPNLTNIFGKMDGLTTN